MRGYRQHWRTRAEAMWLGLLALGYLWGTAALIVLDRLTPLDFPAAFWNRPLAAAPDALGMAALYVSGGLGILADLRCARWIAAANLVWHWAIGLMLFTAGWQAVIGFPAGVLTWGWLACVTLVSLHWEPQERERA